MSSPESSSESPIPSPASLAAKLKQNISREGIRVPAESDPADLPAGATEELLTRLTGHRTVSSRYQLEGEIARGGMGAILRVWDEDLRRTSR